MPHGRYRRPYLEIEYDQESFLRENVCCRYVPVVVRLCSVAEDARLSVLFERVRRQDQDGTYLDAYQVRPHELWKLRKNTDIAGYHEYHLHLLARANSEETGLIHITITSAAGTLLSEVAYRFDCCCQEPCSSKLHPNSFQGIRLLPFVRTPEARDALHGQYPASPPLSPGVPAQVSSPDQQQEISSPLKNYWMTGAAAQEDLHHACRS